MLIKEQHIVLPFEDYGPVRYHEFAVCDAKMKDGREVKFSASLTVLRSKYMIEMNVSIREEFIGHSVYSGYGNESDALEYLSALYPEVIFFTDLASLVATGPFLGCNISGTYLSDRYLSEPIEILKSDS